MLQIKTTHDSSWCYCLSSSAFESLISPAIAVLLFISAMCVEDQQEHSDQRQPNLLRPIRWVPGPAPIIALYLLLTIRRHRDLHHQRSTIIKSPQRASSSTTSHDSQWLFWTSTLRLWAASHHDSLWCHLLRAAATFKSTQRKPRIPQRASTCLCQLNKGSVIQYSSLSFVSLQFPSRSLENCFHISFNHNHCECFRYLIFIDLLNLILTYCIL